VTRYSIVTERRRNMQCPERENLVAGKKMQTGGVLGATGLQDMIGFSIKNS